MSNEEAGSSAAPFAMPPNGDGFRLQPDTRLAERFLVQAAVGIGAFAEIYQAFDEAENRPVVLELLHPELAAMESVRERLSGHAQLVSGLDHKNLAQLIGYFCDGENDFLVNEFVSGSSLREMLNQRLAEGRTFSLKGAYNAISHLCNAFAHAHNRTIHGALTADAVIINPAGRVKITQFGMLWLLPGLSDAQLGDGQAWASIAPEVWAAPDQASPQSDIYSIGVILFELLAGRPPSSGDERPSQLVAGIPPALDGVIGRCLRVQPEERFADAQELQRALHAAVERELTQAAAEVMPTAAPPAPKGPPSRPGTPPPMPVAGPPLPQQFNQGGPPPPMPGQRPTPTGSKRYTEAIIAVDEEHERWLIQKDSLDFGPYRLGDVKSQIESGQILGHHVIVDMDNGEKREVKDHPLLRDLVRLAKERLDAEKMIVNEQERDRARRRRTVILGSTFLGLLIIVGGGVTAYVLKPRQTTKIVYRDRDEELLKGIDITMKVDPPAKVEKHHSGSHRSGGKNDYSDVTALGDATQAGGSETLGQDVVQKVMSANFGVLKGCVLEEKRRNPALRSVDMDFVIKGQTGRVSGVRVNGDTSSPLASCMFGKMQSVVFPKFNGAQTHASFSLALK
ncbi:MAG TPA: protein kinase [Polyangia bacterium]|nr:protein kinase [Polyangia bacterium]